MWVVVGLTFISLVIFCVLLQFICTEPELRCTVDLFSKEKIDKMDQFDVECRVLVKELIINFPGFITDEEVNGADVVDFINDQLENSPRVKEIGNILL